MGFAELAHLIIFGFAELAHLISFVFVDWAWTPIFYLKGFVTDSVQVGEEVFEKSSGTTLGFKFKPSF